MTNTRSTRIDNARAELAAILRSTREAHGLNQTALARRLSTRLARKVSQSQVSKWESGTVPTGDVLDAYRLELGAEIPKKTVAFARMRHRAPELSPHVEELAGKYRRMGLTHHQALEEAEQELKLRNLQEERDAILSRLEQVSNPSLQYAAAHGDEEARRLLDEADDAWADRVLALAEEGIYEADPIAFHWEPSIDYDTYPGVDIDGQRIA